MKTSYLYILLIFLTFSVVSKSQENGFPIIRNYTTKEYKGAPQVFSLIQDNRGVMYFGCGSSILEYDGVSWRSIPNNNQKVFLDFAKDKTGKIYVTAMNEFGYLSHDIHGNTTYQTLTNQFSDTAKIGFVWSVKITSKYVYFFTEDAILQYSPNTKKFLEFKADPNDRFLDCFIHNDILYAQCENSGLIKIENNELRHALQSEFFEKKNVFRTALPFDSTTLLIPTRTEGLYLYQPNKNILPKKFNISDNNFLLNNNIYNASVFQNDYFVLGSVNKGAVLIDKQGTIIQRYQENNLQNSTIRSIMQDKNQNIWFGLENGISKTENTLDISFWDKNSGLKGSIYNVIRFNGTVYIATSIRLYFINKNNQIQEVQNIPVGHNWCFMENKVSNTLLAGSRYGIYEIKGDVAIQICEGTHAAFLFQSIKNPNRVFSAVLPDFMSIRLENGRWISEGKWAGIKDQIRGVIEDENGDLWLGTYRNGVIRVTPNYENITKPKSARYYTQKDGFTSLSDILPFRYKNKIIWGTEKGLYIYNPKTDSFDPFCDLGDDFSNGHRSVYSLTEMPDGKIWICPKENSKADIGYLQKNSKGGFDWIFAPFRRIPEMLIESFYVEPSGIAWVGGSDGLYRYDMRKDTKNYRQSFECLIRKVLVGEDSLLYGGNTSIQSELNPTIVKYQFNTLKFEFAAPFFDHEEKTLYSFKLEGFDKDWSKWSRQTEKEYTDIKEGTYTFHVKARNVYDVESQTSSYQITILAPFYRTWWAYIIYIILIAICVYIIVKFYTHHLIKQKIKLESTIKDKTSEILQQKKELEIINEELNATNEELFNQREELESTLNSLKETQQQLILSEKMASIGVLASGVAHEINNPLNFIQGGILGIKNYFDENLSDHKPNVEFYISCISEGVKRAETIVSGLNFFSRNINLNSDKTDIHTIIDNCLLMLQHRFEDRIEIFKDYTKERFTLDGDSVNLFQAMFNIITNSIQAIDNNGTIIIRTELNTNRIKIYIADSGCGIEKKNLSKILDPFFTTKAPGKGTGLGLSITYNILQEHNGTIEFESEPGKGSTAIISLPITKIEVE